MSDCKQVCICRDTRLRSFAETFCARSCQIANKFASAATLACEVLQKNTCIIVSLKDEDKQKAVSLIRQLVNLGYELYAIRDTSTMLYNEGIKTRAVFRISRGRPNLLDLIHDKEVQWIVNTTENGAEAMVDECQRSEESENMLAYSHLTSKETVRKAYKSRCAPRRSSLASLSPRPSPPSPPPWKASWTSTTSEDLKCAACKNTTAT